MVDVCDVPVISTVCDKAGDAAASLVTAPFNWLAEGMGNAAEWMFKSVWNVFDSTTSVDITSDEYMKVYNRSEEHTSELQSLMRISYAVFCLNKKNNNNTQKEKDSNNNRLQ